ncbi:hypothetical protein, partial [Rhodanobacter ginsenosidimutans]
RSWHRMKHSGWWSATRRAPTPRDHRGRASAGLLTTDGEMVTPVSIKAQNDKDQKTDLKK